jgi:rare lipoprotein A (peptidoglycan hydrolase)
VPQKAPEPQNVPEVYSDPKPSVTVVTPSVPKEAVPVKNNNTSFNGGFFKSYYTQQAAAVASNNDNGMAGIFKSMSGWDDGKYYCLHNVAPAGSFIKITNKATNKVIYAKVLDLMPNLSQNKLLIIQVSSAAAAELGVTGASFDSEIAY